MLYKIWLNFLLKHSIVSLSVKEFWNSVYKYGRYYSFCFFAPKCDRCLWHRMWYMIQVSITVFKSVFNGERIFQIGQQTQAIFKILYFCSRMRWEFRELVCGIWLGFQLERSNLYVMVKEWWKSVNKQERYIGFSIFTPECDQILMIDC